MTTQANIGQAFPLEKLGSDIARNNYNYESILNGIIEWDRTDQPTVTIRLTKDADPFFQDYIIASKKAMCEDDSLFGKLEVNSVFYGGSLLESCWLPDHENLGDLITFRITVLNNGGTTWKLYYKPLVVNWESGSDYRYGNFVKDGSIIYKVNNNVTNSIIIPSLDPLNFLPPGIIPVTTYLVSELDDQEITEVPAFNSSITAQIRLTRDVAGFIIKPVGVLTSTPDITMRISARAQDLPSIYERSVDVFKSGNLSNWPMSDAKAWIPGTLIPETITNPDIRFRQPYSGMMVFNHADPKCKTVNFINYDGPDLDQSLTIYLPVLVETEDGTAEPEDGFTYEFYFRLWPDSSYTDATTRDHIINKAQIYVYTTSHIDNVLANEAANEPIAKFSMAPMTNFYMFGENVSIPDSPITYRASFIYSKNEGRWISLDYYQIPNHLFVGPVGFINNQNPGALDINNEIIGNINPNASFIGYDVCALPMISDVFSNPDLTPYKVNGTDFDDFYNRIVD